MSKMDYPDLSPSWAERRVVPDLALSVRQPWAWAIISGGKDVENRDWRQPNPGLKFRGRVAIHASSGMTRDEYDSVMPQGAPPIPPPHLLVRGAIIGHVQIMDIIRDPGHKMITSAWFHGPVGLMLHDPVAIEPIPCSGALGFFKWRDRMTSAVTAPAKWMLPKPAAAPAAQTDVFNDWRPGR